MQSGDTVTAVRSIRICVSTCHNDKIAFCLEQMRGQMFIQDVICISSRPVGRTNRVCRVNAKEHKLDTGYAKTSQNDGLQGPNIN